MTMSMIGVEMKMLIVGRVYSPRLKVDGFLEYRFVWHSENMWIRIVGRVRP